MTPPQPARAARIEACIHPDALALVRRAAELQGRSLNDFVAEAAEQAARRTMEETHVIRLDVAERHAFVDMLLNPPSPAEALHRAKLHHDQLIGPV